MKRRTWSTSLNSEQYVQLRMRIGVITLSGLQSPRYITVLTSQWIIEYPCILINNFLNECNCCRSVWEKVPRRRATWWRWQPWTTKERPSQCPSPTFTSTACPWYCHQSSVHAASCNLPHSRGSHFMSLYLLRWVLGSLSWKPQWPSGSRLAQDQLPSAGSTSLVIDSFLTLIVLCSTTNGPLTASF